MKSRKLFMGGVRSIDFYDRFSTEDSCYEYLAAIKWESGYKCRRCSNENYCKGRSPHSRRCTRCKFDESASAGTMFDKLKFSIRLAFHIAFKISTKKKGMSSLELPNEFGLRQKTCWEFKWEIQQAMQSSHEYPLTGDVEVDEFYIGGGEEGGKVSRSKGSKRLVIIALEIVKDGVGRAYAEVIEDASTKSFKPFFEFYISKDTNFVADEWSGYLPLKVEYPNMEQRKSENGKSFSGMHLHIMNVKGWLRGIHHHCSRERLQGYLNEYHFRYNRRDNMDTILDVLIRQMVRNNPIRLREMVYQVRTKCLYLKI